MCRAANAYVFFMGTSSQSIVFLLVQFCHWVNFMVKSRSNRLEKFTKQPSNCSNFLQISGIPILTVDICGWAEIHQFFKRSGGYHIPFS